MRHSSCSWTLFSLVAGLCTACSGGSSKVKVTPVAGSTDTGQPAPSPKGEIGFADSPERSCMLHQQAGAYFQCLAGSDGQCFHYGATCVPASRCMYDSKAHLHKLCSESQNGSCLRFGSVCEPAGGCVFSAADNLYRQCSKMNKGACESFGATCQPAP